MIYMVKLLFVKKSGIRKCSNVNIDSLNNLYKKCGFTNNKNFAKRHTWEKNGEYYSLYAKTNGKSGTENKFECPPPIDKELYFGTIVFLKHIQKEISLNTLLPLEEENFNNFYEYIFGGFVDLDETEEESEEEDIDSDQLTKEGYCKWICSR